MRSRRLILVTGLSALVVLLSLKLWRGGGNQPAPASASVRAPAPTRTTSWHERFAQTQQKLTTAASAAESTLLLADLARALAVHPPADAVALLLALLDSGVDAKTGIVFRVGAGGELVGAPTLRVWMLDQLGKFDRRAAADYAQRIYAYPLSADEWAIALRNDWRYSAALGRIEPVRARALELLANPGWEKDPSIGYFESLDVVVATVAWEAVPRLEQWLGPTQPAAMRGAAWIALDRLAMEAPADFLPMLAQHDSWLSTQPLLRAGIMARANVKTEGERQAVEAYLQREDVSPAEGRKFLELLPNVSATVSHNLVTTARILTPQQAAWLDQATLAGVREWQSQVRFGRWAPELAAAEARLAESVAAATRGGYLNL